MSHPEGRNGERYCRYCFWMTKQRLACVALVKGLVWYTYTPVSLSFSLSVFLPPSFICYAWAAVHYLIGCVSGIKLFGGSFYKRDTQGLWFPEYVNRWPELLV